MIIDAARKPSHLPEFRAGSLIMNPGHGMSRPPHSDCWCAANQVELVFLTAYGSWLNWIETEFAALRYFALNGTDHRSHDERTAAIAAYVRWRNARAQPKTNFAVNSPIRTWTRTRPKLRDKPLADGDDAVTVTAAISGPTLLHPVRIHASTTADTPQNRPASTDACRLWSVAQPAPAEQPRTPSHSPTAGARPPSRSPTPPPGSTDVVAEHCRPRLRAADAGQRECIRTIEQGCELSSDGRTQPTRDRCYACFVPAVRAVV
jgi:hypothetical protein